VQRANAQWFLIVSPQESVLRLSCKWKKQSAMKCLCLYTNIHNVIFKQTVCQLQFTVSQIVKINNTTFVNGMVDPVDTPVFNIYQHLGNQNSSTVFLYCF